MSSTTAMHFAVFEREVRKWQKTLSLKDWKIYVTHGKTDNAYAEVKWSLTDKIATITFSKNSWDDLHPLTDEGISQIALHEVLHVLLADLCCIAETREFNRMQLDTAEHGTLRRIEQALLKKEFDND